MDHNHWALKIVKTKEFVLCLSMEQVETSDKQTLLALSVAAKAVFSDRDTQCCPQSISPRCSQTPHSPAVNLVSCQSPPSGVTGLCPPE